MSWRYVWSEPCMYWFIVHSYTHWTVTFVVQWHAHSPKVSMNNRTAKVVVLYLFMITCIEIWYVRSLGRIKSSRLRLFFDEVPEKIACSGFLLSECLEQATEKKGMDLWKQMSSKWSFTSFCGIFWLKLVTFRDYSLCSVCILHQTCVLLSVCSLHFTPGPQCAFYTDRKLILRTRHKMCVTTFTVLTLC